MKKFFKQYQKEVAELVKKFNFNWSVYVQYIHLVEEVGELGETLTVMQGDRQVGSGEKALADHGDIVTAKQNVIPVKTGI